MKKGNIKYVVISVVIFITLILFIATKLSKRSDDRTDTLISQVDASIIRAHIIDSLSSILAMNEIQVIDSVNKERNKERVILKDEIQKEKSKSLRLIKERDSLLEGYLADTLSQSDKCDEIIEKDNEIISSQQITISKLETDTTILSFYLRDTEKKYYIEVSNHNRTKDLNELCNKNTMILMNNLRSKNTWYKRNEKWIYFGSGIVLTGIAVNYLK